MNAITNLPWKATNEVTATTAIRALQDALEVLKGVELSHSEAANLAPLAGAIKDVAAFTATVHAEIENRVLVLGKSLPGVAVGDVVVHRRWSDVEATTQLAREKFGDKAFTAPTLLSPAGIEKLGADGKAFVALCSEKPAAPKKVVY